jgi:hypothetical protein
MVRNTNAPSAANTASFYMLHNAKLVLPLVSPPTAFLCFLHSMWDQRLKAPLYTTDTEVPGLHTKHSATQSA